LVETKIYKEYVNNENKFYKRNKIKYKMKSFLNKLTYFYEWKKLTYFKLL
jgi:hypothetical protein